jgi:hypothetical protein
MTRMNKRGERKSVVMTAERITAGKSISLAPMGEKADIGKRRRRWSRNISRRSRISP